MSRSFAVLAACLFLTAGCLGFAEQQTPEPTQDVEVSISNGHDRPYDVRVSVVPEGPTNVDLSYANGTTRRRPVSELTSVSPSQLGNITDARLVGQNVTSEEFRVSPTSGIGASLTIDPGASIWMIVRTTTGENRLRAWAQFSCRPETEVVNADLTIGPNGTIAVATTCGSA